MATKLRICGNDPGSKNYGLAVIEVSLSNPLTLEQRKPKVNKVPLSVLSFKVLHLRKVQSTYTGLISPKEIEIQTVNYINEIASVLKEYKVDFMVAERYMSRRMGGSTIELVNMMIGTLRGVALSRRSPLKVIPAAQWKVPLKNKEFNLESVYKKAKMLKISDHEVDAIFIALYGAFTLMRRKPFFMADIDSLERGVLRDLKRIGVARIKK